MSALRIGGNDDSGEAQSEPSHVLDEAAGPLIPISQSGRGCWEQAVLGNDLAGGPRDGERVKREEHAEGDDEGEQKRGWFRECREDG